MVEYISYCVDKGIVFNPDKFHFAGRQVEFTGFLVIDNGVEPTKRMTEAIFHFPTPTSITGIRSWFGLVKQVSSIFTSGSHGPLSRTIENKEQKVPLGWDTWTTIPRVEESNRGENWKGCSNVRKNLLKNLGIRKHTSSSYYPQSN